MTTMQRVDRSRGGFPMATAITTIAMIATPSIALAATGVTAEATDVYCDPSGNNCSSIVCIAEADNYRKGS
jgi:hypothetical protein